MSADTARARTADVWTIGHGAVTAEVFAERVAANRIAVVVDVRSLPGSRRYPHFDQETMREWLSARYIHLPLLGGRRKSQPDAGDENAGWTNPSFRNFADYAQTMPFEDGLQQLLQVAGRYRTAIMCSETVPWRCHRSMIANELVARGHRVHHILQGRIIEHELGLYGASAEIRNGHVVYPADQMSMSFDA